MSESTQSQITTNELPEQAPQPTLEEIRWRLIGTINAGIMSAQERIENDSLRDWNRYLQGINESWGLYSSRQKR